MKLHHATASPFVRKVMVMAHETGLVDRIELVPVQVTPLNPSDALIQDNPLSKIPCLVTDDEMPLFDSRVICEYLDGLHDGPKLIPSEPERRWPILRLAALCDETMDALVLTRYETFIRPEEKRWQPWIDSQMQKVRRVLDDLEGRAEHYEGMLCIGTITLGCMLGYIDFRFADEGWRNGRPKLAAWYDGFATRPSMKATIPV